MEISPLAPELENGAVSPSSEFSALNLNSESSPAADEFFPESRQAPKRKKNRQKNAALKMIAAVATVSVGVAAVFTSLIHIPKPTVKDISVTDVREVSNTEIITDFPAYSYDVCFTFDLDGCTPDGVSIVGEAYYEFEYGERMEQTPISAELPANELQNNKDGTVTAKYTVQASDPYVIHSIYAILKYTDNTDSENPKQGTLKSEEFLACFPTLSSEQLRTNDSITAVISEDEIICTVSFNLLHKGCFEFRAEQLTLEFGGEIFRFGGEGEPLLNAKFVDGKFVFTKSFPKPQGDSVVMYAELEGDCYYENKKLNIASYAFSAKEIILTDSYSLPRLSFENISVNGLTLTHAEYYTEYEGLQEEVPQILSGRTVIVMLHMKGNAVANGTLTADIAVNGQKITDADFTYATTTVSENASEAILEFLFTMPDMSITADDIKINGINFTPEV